MKLYPFSARKNEHNIDLYKNHLFNVMHDMEVGEIAMDSTRYKKISAMYHGELQELRSTMVGGCPVVYLTGKQIALAKKIVMWAENYRAEKWENSEHRKKLQYC